LGEPWQQFESFPVGVALPVTIMMDNAFSDDFKRFVNERLATLQQSGVIDNILARYSVQ
jgi:ABC-type amino acid transport substrate-binding protein